MTTIAYRDGIIAGDGRETDVDNKDCTFVLRDNLVKVHRLKDGRLFGSAGGSEEGIRLLIALQNNQPMPKLEEIAGLLIDTKGKIWVYEGHLWQPAYEKYYAVGTGACMAFAAMDAGASAVKAVTIAKNRDPFSGGKVTSLKLRR